jgi:hypothetical protein
MDLVMGGQRLDMTPGAKRATAFLFLFALALAAVNLLFTARQVNEVTRNTASITRNAANITQLCQAINGNRHRQIILWQYLITAFPPAHETPSARQERLRADRTLMVTVDRIFAPSNCQHP